MNVEYRKNLLNGQIDQLCRLYNFGYGLDRQAKSMILQRHITKYGPCHRTYSSFGFKHVL